MRITEGRMVERASLRVMEARRKVNEDQQAVSTGLAVSRPSQDAAAWTEGKRTEARMTMSEARGNNIAKTRERLDEVDRVFATVGEVLSRARELAVLAANDSYDADNRAVLATEIRTLRAGAMSAANTRSADGEYLLSGSFGDRAPFDDAGAYLGDDYRRDTEISESSKQVGTVPGERLTALAGIDVFDTLERFAVALENDDKAGIHTALGELDTGIQQVSRTRAESGSLINALDLADDARRDLELVLAEAHQRAVEADAIEAATDLAQSMSAMESASAVVQRLVEMLRV